MKEEGEQHEGVGEYEGFLDGGLWGPDWPSWLLPQEACRAAAALALHSEALPFAGDVAQPQVDVGADALHGLQRQWAAQVLGVGPGGGQAEAEPVGAEEVKGHILGTSRPASEGDGLRSHVTYGRVSFAANQNDAAARTTWYQVRNN